MQQQPLPMLWRYCFGIFTAARIFRSSGILVASACFQHRLIRRTQQRPSLSSSSSTWQSVDDSVLRHSRGKTIALFSSIIRDDEMSKNTMDGDDDDAIPDRVWVQLYIEDEKEGDVVQVMTKEPDATFRSMIEIKSIAQAVQKAHAVLDPLPDSLIVLDMYAFHDAKTKLSKIDEWNPKVHGGDVENRPMTAKLEAAKFSKSMSTYWYILGIPAQRQGQSFVDALLAPNAIQDIPGGERFGLRVMPDFPLIPIRSKIRRDIVFRQAVQDFWLECIRNTDILHHRVCALGTSEVGQTKATVQLFSLLLQQQRTVVYRSHDYLWYFEFRPVPSNDDSRDGSAATGTTAYPQAQPKYVCTVYPSKYTADKDILSLRDPNTYYIVDHSFRPDEVRPIERNIPARLIIVAPPRSVFWGDEGFSKASDDCGSCTNGGIFVVHPPWTLDELLLARPYLNKNFVREPFGDTPPLSEDDVKARFYIFGGVPGRIFCDTVSRNLLLSLQRRYATDPMDIEKVSNILSGKADPTHWEHQRERTSSLLLTLTPNGSDFIDYLSTPASLGVAFQLMTNFRDELGAEVERHNDNSLFEPYAAYLLGHKVKEVQARPCVAPTDAAAYKDYQTIRLGGYQQVEYAPDIAAQAIQRPNVLFMSTTRLAYPFCTDQKQLIDFVYSKIVNGKIHVHAFKATLGVQYDMDETQMMRLMEQLERAGVDSASLYFLVCPPEFDKFGTNPPSPSAHYGLDNARTQLFLYHVKVIDAYHTVAVEDDNE